MTRKGTHGGRDENGAVLVIWVVALTVLLLFVGVAVDLGNLSQTVRLSQNSVDSAALLGAQELGLNTSATQMVTDVEAQFVKNYPAASSWNWGNCVAVGGFTYVGGQSCVGYATTATGTIVVDVVIPKDNKVAFTGFSSRAQSSVSVNVSAQASVQSPGGIALLPIGITSTAGGGGEFCIKGGNGKVSCGSKIAAGDQGAIDSPRLRTFTSATDNGSGNDDTTTIDVAIGLDHSLQVFPYPSAGTYYCDSNGSSPATGNKCQPGTLNSLNSANFDEASQIFPLSGNTSNTILQGLVHSFSAASCSFQPRLAHPDGFSPGSTCTSVGSSSNNPASPIVSIDGNNTLNGRQISWYMVNGENGQTVPAGGPAEYATAYADVNALYGSNAPSVYNVDSAVWSAADDQQLAADMKTQTASASPTPWFSSSISQSPRFAFVPVLDPSCGGGASGFCSIMGFEAAYIDQAFVQGKDLSFIAWIFSPKMIKNGPAPPGAGSGSFFGGPFVVNLCHETWSGSALVGNC
ncbi:MAG TPA: Tad domain-containing protein [Acidimicrobiales bacterium]|nr:Tad domain-containing protein [Acidimicrobiales bacterium]